MAGLAARQISRTEIPCERSESAMPISTFDTASRMKIAPSVSSPGDAAARRAMTSVPAPIWGLGRWPWASVSPRAPRASHTMEVVPRSRAGAVRCSLSGADFILLWPYGLRRNGQAHGVFRVMAAGQADAGIKFRRSEHILFPPVGAGGTERKCTRHRPQWPMPAHSGRGGRCPRPQRMAARFMGAAGTGMSISRRSF